MRVEPTSMFPMQLDSRLQKLSIKVQDYVGMGWEIEEYMSLLSSLAAQHSPPHERHNSRPSASKYVLLALAAGIRQFLFGYDPGWYCASFVSTDTIILQTAAFTRNHANGSPYSMCHSI
jgi:hypothetical protein